MSGRGIFSFLLLAVAAVSCRHDPRDTNLEQVAANINAKCPQMIDSETRLDRVDFVTPDTLRYIYSLVNLDPGKIDTTQFREAMWPGLLAHIRVTSSLQPLKDKAIVFQYLYLDNSGGYVHRFTVDSTLY